MFRSVPISMPLFGVVLNPLICLLERYLMGIRIGQRTKKTAMMAYANNVTIFITSLADIFTIEYILLFYVRATGARLNIRKSKAKPAGLWDKSMNRLIIPRYREITVLCFRFTGTAIRTGNVTCSWTTGKVKALAREPLGHKLLLKQ